MERELANVPIEKGCLELQVRPVHVTRGTSPPGVKWFGYDRHAPNSLDAIVYDEQPTGRPVSLIVGNDADVGLILSVVSDRLYKSWLIALERSPTQGRRFVGDQHTKLMRHSVKNQDPTTGLKAILSSCRSDLKHHEGQVAHFLVNKNREGALTDHVLLTLLGCDRPDRFCALPMVHLVEQFGLVELPADYSVNPDEALAIEVTEYCLIQAEAYVQEVDAQKAAVWEAKRKQLSHEVAAARFKLDRLKVQLDKQEAQLTALEGRLAEHLGTEREPSSSVTTEGCEE
ncbi:MAG: hypothetical protein CEO22_74 [Candidatus Berkelbacteria bacterium Gr01-1014_85]|uniref:Uncharacterized protein n=1 Tax=Candidatus Berkelbacteria bacterium Gr01-1014_85 TaxID=2017150 RepID=A0A554JDN6_9BACT|nr:MAG: hypothetical protein CEO22_74 [Candidatus Berkelbacteria bacterium Gr01-1014_85]